jgi:hypothetical protein
VEAPLLEQIYQDYKEQGMVAVAIGANQNQAAALTWVNTHGLTHPVLADPTGSVWSLFSMGYVPHNAITNCADVITFTNYGFNENQIRNLIVSALDDLIDVDHAPLKDTEYIMTPVSVTANIQADSAFMSGYPRVVYRINGGLWSNVEMNHLGGATYSADIPGQPVDTIVDYYIRVEQVDGCPRTVPMPNQFYSFFVGTDVIPPVIEHTWLPLVSDNMLPLKISAHVTDNLGVESVDLEYQINNAGFSILPMENRGSVYEVIIPEVLEIGDIIDYRIIAEDQAQVPNFAYDPVAGYHETEVIEQIPAIVVDLDGSRNSGPVIRDHIQAILGSCDYSTTMPASLNIYESAFVCLGMFSTNHVLSGQESDVLVSLLDAGGRLYMEGGDTWFYDSRTDVHDYFNIIGVADGSGDAGPEQNGVADTFTDGMTLGYNTAQSFNNWVDRIDATNGSFVMLRNSTPVYNTGVAFDGRAYKTVGSSIKIGGLIDNTTTVHEYVETILVFFDMIEPPEPTPTPTHTPTPGPTATPGDCINHGDANLDGILTAADAQLVFQFVIGGETPTFEQECAADCNGDEVISAADAQLVFLTVLGQETCVDPL